MPEYRVQLPVFSGPLDLLLYLVKEKEVEISEIPVGQITDQFLEYLTALSALDLDQAGEFLVMASTLMEIKSRMLLPEPTPEELAELEEMKSDLIRQLLEYRQFREAATDLNRRWESQSSRFGRTFPELPDEDPPADAPSAPLAGVELWDLVKAFAKVLRETAADLPQIRYDDIPQAVQMERIANRVQGASEGVSFLDLCAERNDRLFLIGTFLGLLELVHLLKVRISLVDGEIRVFAA